MKKQLIGFGLLLLSISAAGQKADTAKPKETLVHNPSTYIDFQFPIGDEPMVTSQLWFYIRKFYVEARYNYEDRKTGSLYFGRSFKFGSHQELEVIPMVGGSVGRFTGLSPAATIILEAGWIRGFCQSQYSFTQSGEQSNFLFNWTALVLHVYKPLYLGGSSQIIAPYEAVRQLYYGPMISLKEGHFYIEGFAYNCWESKPMWALAVQYNY